MKTETQTCLTDKLGRVIRKGDWAYGPYKSQLLGVTVMQIKKKVVYTTKGRWFPEQLIIVNDVPIKNREPLSPWITNKYGNVDFNTDQLKIEVLDKKEESNNVSEDSSDRMRGDRIIFGSTPGETN